MTSEDLGPWVIAEAISDSPPNKTERERVGEILRERILTGLLTPNSRIDLDRMAEEFGTSRTPVREACLALAQEGLVKVAQRSGIVVIGVTPETILDNFALMAALSGIAAQWAAQRISPKQLLRVRELSREVSIAAQSGEDIAILNWLFHREVNKASCSPRLLLMIGEAGRMIPRSYFALFPEQIPCSLDEHGALVRALASRDGLAARQISEKHFEGAAEVLSQYVVAPHTAQPASV